MIDININNITEEHLLGNWKIQDRVAGPGIRDSILQHQNEIHFMPQGAFKSRNGKEMNGKWTFFKQMEIIYNPQVSIEFSPSETSNAIITRLCMNEGNNDNYYMLILYFSSGLELILRKTL